MRQKLLRSLKICLISLFAIIIFSPSVFLLVKIRITPIQGKSMFPTITNGDVCIVYKTRDIERGNVVLIDMGNDTRYVKRIVGVGGDEVFICNSGIAVNGKVVYEPHILFYNTGEPSRLILLKENELWFMGDNRSNSHDSRALGPVTNDKIIGRVIWVLGRSL